jgi:tetratricopeptide (TPR) repeat protein
LEGVHPEQALEDAQILASLAPTSGHMVHMPGHIYYRLGDYARAERAFADSLQADERYMREQSVKADDNWNYVHNLMYAVANVLEEGKRKKAEELSLKLAKARGELASTLYTFSPRDSISRIEPGLPVALRVADWPQAVGLVRAAAEPTQPNLHFLKQSIANFAEGMQAVSKADVAAAAESSRKLDALLKEAAQRMTPPAPGAAPTAAASTGAHQMPVMPDALLAPLVSYLSVLALELRGSLLILEKDPTSGGMLFTQAADQAKDLGYREPPSFIRPVGEAHGAALLAAQDWLGARAAYMATLAERPRSGFALSGIARSFEGAGDIRAAVAAYGEFLEAWKDADAGSPEVAHARSYVSEHAR